uniref:Ig-like domain-containing protein n=1 Tax=Mus spicilegus TaxID=10103 RepID=A0A8C6HEH6_MUSSI
MTQRLWRRPRKASPSSVYSCRVSGEPRATQTREEREPYKGHSNSRGLGNIDDAVPLHRASEAHPQPTPRLRDERTHLPAQDLGIISPNTKVPILIGFSLLAFLLTCWNAPAAAELTIELVPPMVAEGGNSVLFVHEMPLNVQAFYWYKQRDSTKSYEVARYLTPTNQSSKMPQHSDRKTVFYSGSLLIRNVTKADSGVYTLLTFNTEMESELTHVHLEVQEPVAQPTLQADSTAVTEAGSVTLTCFSEDPGLSIRWLFNHQGLYFNDRMTLSQKNSRLTIDPAKREDAGEYQCQVSNGYSSKMSLPLQMSVTSE